MEKSISFQKNQSVENMMTIDIAQMIFKVDIFECKCHRGLHPRQMKVKLKILQSISVLRLLMDINDIVEKMALFDDLD